MQVTGLGRADVTGPGDPRKAHGYFIASRSSKRDRTVQKIGQVFFGGGGGGRGEQSIPELPLYECLRLCRLSFTGSSLRLSQKLVRIRMELSDPQCIFIQQP